MEHTDLEKKLLEYILFLLGVTNVQSKALQLLGEYNGSVFNWIDKNFKEWDVKNKQIEMNEFLNKEFDWDLHFDPTGNEMTLKEEKNEEII